VNYCEQHSTPFSILLVQYAFHLRERKGTRKGTCDDRLDNTADTPENSFDSQVLHQENLA